VRFILSAGFPKLVELVGFNPFEKYGKSQNGNLFQILREKRENEKYLKLPPSLRNGPAPPNLISVRTFCCLVRATI